MSEIPSGSPENILPEPNMLCAAFMIHASQIIPPYERAETYASFVPSVEKIYPKIALECVAEAQRATEQVLDRPPAEMDNEAGKHSANILLRYVANTTMNEALIRRLDEKYRNPLLVDLAVKQYDDTLVPTNVKSQDAYKRKVALRDYDLETARQIEDPARRASALADLLHALDVRNSQLFDVDLDVLRALENEAWEALVALSVEEGQYPGALINFAVARGPSFIVQIPWLQHRASAINMYRSAAADRGDREGGEWCRNQYAAELSVCQNDYDRGIVVKALAASAMEAADPSMSDLIPEGSQYMRLKALTWLNSSIKKAIITNDAEALLALEDGPYRQQALAQLAVLPGNERLILHIEDAVLHLGALSEIAAIKNDPQIKLNVFKLIKLDLVSGGALARHGVDLAQIAINLQDPLLIRPLFQEDLLSPTSLTKIAVALKSPDLVNSIKDAEARSSAFIGLAIALRQTAFIALSNASPAEKARAFHSLFNQTATEGSL